MSILSGQSFLLDGYFIIKGRGVCGRVVMVVNFKPLAPHRYGFKSRKGFGILSGDEAVQLAY
jgi:hypothetical protein